MPRVAAKAARSAGSTSGFVAIAGSMTGRRPISAGSAGRNRSPRKIRPISASASIFSSGSGVIPRRPIRQRPAGRTSPRRPSAATRWGLIRRGWIRSGRIAGGRWGSDHAVAVGTEVSPGPPHRSERAELLHSAPILSTSDEPIPRSKRRFGLHLGHLVDLPLLVVRRPFASGFALLKMA